MEMTLTATHAVVECCIAFVAGCWACAGFAIVVRAGVTPMGPAVIITNVHTAGASDVVDVATTALSIATSSSSTIVAVVAACGLGGG